MKAVVFDQIGPPVDVLRLANVEIPRIRENEVLVRMLAAPINPGDFLFIQNLYTEPKKPPFPQQIAGNYGAGVVEKAGKKTGLTQEHWFRLPITARGRSMRSYRRSG